MKDVTVKVDIKTGLAVRKLEVLRDAIDVLIQGLDGIEEKYCEDCGARLITMSVNESDTIKECSNCNQKFVFRTRKVGE